jgi:uncharacterized protein with FMN-binding domain
MELSRRSFIEGSIAAGATGVAGMGIARRAHAVESSTADGKDGSSAQSFDYDALNAWLKERTNYSAFRGYHHGGKFLEGEENAPTNDEIIEMLKIANSYMYCHCLTAPHYIVIRDVDEQNAVLSKMGTTHSGTVTLLALADGSRDQEHHEELYNASDDDLDYWQLDQGLIELGESLAYFNLAARSLGYRIRNFSALSLENLSVKEGITGDKITADGHPWYGDWDVMQGYGPDISKYAVGKDGTTEFTHYSLEIDRDISVAGNLSVHFAIVIGKIDEDDLATNVSDHKAWVWRTNYPADQRREEFNWAIWDDSLNGASLYEPDEEFKQACEDFEAKQAEEESSATDFGEIPADAKYGSAEGFHSTVEVAVATDDKGVITGVWVTEENDSPNLGGEAAKVMPAEFVGLSTAEEIQAVDGYSGATHTSQAIRDAVQAALGL